MKRISGAWTKWHSWARKMTRGAHALVLAARDPRTPWCARLLAVGVAVYVFSPIDPIPDFIPLVGYLEELVLLPPLIALLL